mgnify:CR=1 FL=1
MAKKSKIVKNQQRIALVDKYKNVRNELVSILKDENASIESKMDAMLQLSKLPRNSSKVRVRNRCALTGRPRGYMGIFELSRIAFRELALDGKLPGIKKTSW